QERVDPKVQWAPSAVPDRIVLSWTGDPSTTQAVTWRTAAGTKLTRCQYAPAGHGPKFARSPQNAEGTSEPLTTDLGPARYHTVELAELRPDTLYAYRVGDGVNWSEWSHFRTAAAGPARFSFIYFGDAQNALKSQWSRVVRESVLTAPDAKFMLHAGDLINVADADAHWGEWFYAAGWLNRRLPSMSVPGNHEYMTREGGGFVHRLSAHWRPTFALPRNGPEGLAETAYHFDYQGVRFVMLNTNEQREAQVQWLSDVLEANTQRWTILMFHHPLYSAAQARDNKQLRALWQPVIDRHRVDLVLQGHDHTYARSPLLHAGSNLAEGVTQHDSKAGTVYVVSVSGPKMYRLGSVKGMDRVAADTQLFQVITVDGGELRYDAYTATAERYDGFTLQKQPEGPNTLTNRLPKTPERR
ncbi:MAG: purple acid phosphatase family protein, partial [Planctomycetota bacterium]